MIDLCKDDKYLLTHFDKDEKENVMVDLFGMADEAWLKENHFSRYIDFMGYGEWSLHDEEEVVLLYMQGNYYFSKETMEAVWKRRLKEEDLVEEPYLEKFGEIIGELQKQEHGTCMIVLDKDEINSEVKRLCLDCNRGTQITEGLDLTQKKNRKFIKGFTSLDGALLVDTQGVCYAFGVILDGTAAKQGNPAKGARHNSALTYIEGKAGRGAVVVSEDRTVMIKKSK